MAPKAHNPVASGAVHHDRLQTTPKAGPVQALQPEPVLEPASQPAAAPPQTAVASPEPAELAPAGKELVLSNTVISRSDISKCLREVKELNDYFHQASIRGSKDQPLPTLGRVLDGLAKANDLNMLHDADRQRLEQFLTTLKAQAPVVHMSFPTEASDSFLAKILDWFRAEVHPHIVLHIGMQPELAAGCVVRTTNKLFDFSFRKRFEKSKQKLMAALEALDTPELNGSTLQPAGGIPAAMPVAPAAPAQPMAAPPQETAS